jgi:hypothetical protein
MEEDVPHRPGKLYKLKNSLKRKNPSSLVENSFQNN